MRGMDYRVEIESDKCYVKWDTMTLEGLLEVDDEIIVIYQKKT